MSIELRIVAHALVLLTGMAGAAWILTATRIVPLSFGDLFLLTVLFTGMIVAVGSAWHYISGEVEYRQNMKALQKTTTNSKGKKALWDGKDK